MTSTRSIGAKINILLDVLGKRPDGYHTIRTLFLPLSAPRDTVTICAAASGLSLETRGIPSPSGPDNLAWRAAVAFSERTGIDPAWSIALTKEIPVAAGLGGGSADAAGVLLALNENCGEVLSTDDLHVLATDLGADVSFFLYSKPSIGDGIGDQLTPIDLGSSLHVALLNPAFPVPVRWAYENCVPLPEDASRKQRFRDLLHALKTCDLAAIGHLSGNDLEAAIRTKFPIVEMMIELLMEEGCTGAHVSGSGPTVYGIGERLAVERAVVAAGEYFGEAVWCRSTMIESLHS